MGNPRAAQGILDAAVPGLDDIGGNGADKGIERFHSDRVYHALAYSFRIKSSGGKA
jgi:hypothetical protein